MYRYIVIRPNGRQVNAMLSSIGHQVQQKLIYLWHRFRLELPTHIAKWSIDLTGSSLQQLQHHTATRYSECTWCYQLSKSEDDATIPCSPQSSQTKANQRTNSKQGCMVGSPARMLSAILMLRLFSAASDSILVCSFSSPHHKGSVFSRWHVLYIKWSI